MRNLIALLILSGAGWVGYQHFAKDSPAYATYKKFADFIAEDKFNEASSLAQDDASNFVEQLRSEREIKRGESGGGFSSGGLQQMMKVGQKQAVQEVRGTSDQTDYKLLSQIKSPDGNEVDIEAQQTDKRSSPEGAMPRVFFWKHKAKLKNLGTEWKIVSFSEESLK